MTIRTTRSFLSWSQRTATPHSPLSRENEASIKARAIQTFLVEGILPRGLSLLAGAPKTGKSYMVQQLAIAVAEGGTFLGAPVEQGDVLCLALEEGATTPKEIIQELSLSGPQVSSHLATLVKGGHVIRISHGVYNYVQPTAGRQPEVNSDTPPEVTESDEPLVTASENPGVEVDNEFDFLTF